MFKEPWWYRIFYLYVSSFCFRLKYYLAWITADMVSNASGLGFNGYDEYSEAKWDLVTGVDVFKLEVD
jgi:lysophospholipid acyltransferase